MEQLVKGKELIVRKRMASFLEKLLRYCGYDFRHDLYKQIIYDEMEFKTPFEEMVKYYYDAYNYLLNNHINPFSREILRRFFFILNGKEPDEALIIRMTTQFFKFGNLSTVEKATEFHMYVYSELSGMEQHLRLIVSLMFFNYTLLKGGIPIIHFLRTKLGEYEECRDKYIGGDSAPILKFAMDAVFESKFQEKKYYKNLKALTSTDICTRLGQDKEKLREEYGVNSMYVFGSFAKGTQRFDSDIDLLVEFSQNLSYDRKRQVADELEIYYKMIFNRFIDINEISQYVSEEIINEVTKYIKIF